MEYIFIDAENLGKHELCQIETQGAHKVFIFSKIINLKGLTKSKHVSCISNYPSGKNQADFYLIATLTKAILALSSSEKETSIFSIYTKDKALITAFEFQCKLHQVAFDVPLKYSMFGGADFACVIKKLLNSPQKAEQLRKKVNVSKSEFTREFNKLVSAQIIKRSPDSRKKWVNATP